MNNSSVSVARVHAALAKPVYQRCVEVRRVVEELSTKELHTVLPLIVENIFGFNNQAGWGLGTIRAQYQDFREMRRLLEPAGPLLSALYKLSTDPYLRYDFPVACLPLPTQKALEEGNVPPLYADKLQMNPAGRPHTFLSLNAFEYYFFHFTYFLIGPALSRTSGWTNPSESLYPVLLEDYLQYFLPASGQPPSLAPHSQGVKTAISHYHSPLHAHRSSPNTSVRASTPGRSPLSSLLRLQRSSPSLTGGGHTASPGGVEAGEQGAWRSSVLLQILVEFWLNHVETSQDRFSMHTQNLRRERGVLYRASSPPDHMAGHMTDPLQYIMSESFLPSLDHVRLVRMLVKHLHYFTNSAKPDFLSSQHQAASGSQWDEFKRTVIPQFVQKKLYTFIKHSFEHWPLDSSFRLILETWLSYIQPWRYTDTSLQRAGREPETGEGQGGLDQRWKAFVLENLLFYSVLLHSFLQRCLRLDLSVPRNAYMLFRATKVMNTHSLSHMINDAECSLFEPSISPSFHATDLGASYLGSPSRHGNLPGMLTMQFSELEGPMFQYTPLYGEATVRMVQNLVRLIQEAKESASQTSRKSQDGDGSFLSWLGFSPSGDLNTSRLFAQEVDEFGERGGERDGKRLSQHLEQAAHNLCQVFQLEVPDHPAERSVSWGSSGSGQQTAETLAPDVYDTGEGPQLSPLGRYQLANGLRKFDVDFEGDPDLQPIRSFESAPLVRMCYALSMYFNNKYHSEMQSYYRHPGFSGRFARQFLSPPFPPSSSGCRDDLHTSPRSRRVCAREARVSLRWLGSYRSLCCLLVAYVLVYWCWGLGPVSFAILALLLTAMYGVVMAIIRPKGKSA